MNALMSSARQTVVLFLDDMQWVDRDTTALLADLMRAPDAPALLLVGHGSDYAIDFAEGHAGLLYSRKREFPGDASATVKDAFVRALRAAKKLGDVQVIGTDGVPDAVKAIRAGEMTGTVASCVTRLPWRS